MGALWGVCQGSGLLPEGAGSQQQCPGGEVLTEGTVRGWGSLHLLFCLGSLPSLSAPQRSVSLQGSGEPAGLKAFIAVLLSHDRLCLSCMVLPPLLWHLCLWQSHVCVSTAPCTAELHSVTEPLLEEHLPCAPCHQPLCRVLAHTSHSHPCPCTNFNNYVLV